MLPAVGQSHIVAMTASGGERPDRAVTESDEVYRLLLDPDSAVTYVVELRTDRWLPLFLWDGDAYHRTELARAFGR